MGENNIDVLETEVKTLKSEVKSIKENIVDMFSRMNLIERVNDVVNEKLDNIKSSQKEIKDDFKALAIKVEIIMQEPAKRWNSLVATTIAVLVTSAIAFFVGKALGK